MVCFDEHEEVEYKRVSMVIKQILGDACFLLWIIIGFEIYLTWIIVIISAFFKRLFFFPFSGGQHIAGEMMGGGDICISFFVLVCMFCFAEFEHGHAMLYHFSFVLHFFLLYFCSLVLVLFVGRVVLLLCFVFLFFVVWSLFSLLGVKMKMKEAVRENWSYYS